MTLSFDSLHFFDTYLKERIEQKRGNVEAVGKVQSHRIDLIRKRSALIIRLEEMRNDPAAVKSIEAELLELTRQAEDLKPYRPRQEDKPPR